MYILAHSGFSAFLFPHNKLGNSTLANIDWAQIEALLLLMHLLHFCEALRLGRGSRSAQGGPLIFLAGADTFSILSGMGIKSVWGKLQD